MLAHSLSASAILRRRHVESQSGYPRSTLYLRISQGLWTRPVKLGPRAVGWPSDEVTAINAARIAGQSDAEIRALVTRLEAGRKASTSASSPTDASRPGSRGQSISS